jgi:DNA-binding NtrC family response regulator
VRLLQRHPWPGNVRELMNVLESALLFASGEVLGPESFELSPELFAPPVTASTPRLVPVPVVEPSAPVTFAGASAPPEAPGEVDFYALLRGRGQSLKDLREELETRCIAAALRDGSGNISEAARILGMKRSRLSQIVNADPALLLLSKGGAEGLADDGPDLAEGAD